MPGAVRVGDPTDHGGSVAGPGVPQVLIGGVPAAVAGDNHVCAKYPDPPTPFPAGSTKVMIGGKPALRAGDKCGCAASVPVGLATVKIN